MQELTHRIASHISMAQHSIGYVSPVSRPCALLCCAGAQGVAAAPHVLSHGSMHRVGARWDSGLKGWAGVRRALRGERRVGCAAALPRHEVPCTALVRAQTREPAARCTAIVHDAQLDTRALSSCGRARRCWSSGRREKPAVCECAIFATVFRKFNIFSQHPSAKE